MCIHVAIRPISMTIFYARLHCKSQQNAEAGALSLLVNIVHRMVFFHRVEKLTGRGGSDIYASLLGRVNLRTQVHSYNRHAFHTCMHACGTVKSNKCHAMIVSMFQIGEFQSASPWWCSCTDVNWMYMYHRFQKTKKVCDKSPECEMGGWTRILHEGRPDKLMKELNTFIAEPVSDAGQ